jgi:histone acetyltransferase MYST4
MASPQNHQNLTQQQLQQLQIQQMQQYNHHQQMHQSNYLSHMSGGNGQSNLQAGYAQASPNTSYSTVIQHRMSNHSNLSAQNSLPSPHQRLGPSPSSCAVSSNNFYQQNQNASHQTSHTPGPIATPTPSATPTPQMEQSCQQMSNASTLSKLQQLASLDIPNQACNTPPSVVLTPPPHSHMSMTPSPSPHLMNQNRSISTPPQGTIQPQMAAAALQYKFYGANMNPIAQNTGRNARTPAPPSVQQMTGSRVSPNVTIGNIYGINGYRMAGQQTTGVTGAYITNPAAAGFINNAAQLPVMNMQTQYQDPSAIQRAQQNSMYSTYSPYLSTLNGGMRR